MRSMVKWVCQIVTHVRHRAPVFDTRLFAGNAADDTLVTGGTFRFCRLMCPCVKRRNIMLNDKRRSLLNSALFRADYRTEQKTISPFSLASIFTFDFAALSERRSCPEDRSRRFVPVGTLRRHKLHIARFRVKHESSFISLLLLFPPNPLRWVSTGALILSSVSSRKAVQIRSNRPDRYLFSLLPAKPHTAAHRGEHGLVFAAPLLPADAL